jgi:hypothetical protein
MANALRNYSFSLSLLFFFFFEYGRLSFFHQLFEITIECSFLFCLAHHNNFKEVMNKSYHFEMNSLFTFKTCDLPLPSLVLFFSYLLI